MPNERDINSEDSLELEIESIRNVFKDLKPEELPLRILWGTKKAFEEMERYIRPMMTPEAERALEELVDRRGKLILATATKIAQKRKHPEITADDIAEAYTKSALQRKNTKTEPPYFSML